MRVTGFDILIVEIPMKISVEHALAERQVARNVLVAAHDGDGHTGWGESCPRAYVTGETVESAVDELRERILPQLVGRECADLDDVSSMALGILDGLAREPSPGSPKIAGKAARPLRSSLGPCRGAPGC